MPAIMTVDSLNITVTANVTFICGAVTITMSPAGVTLVGSGGQITLDGATGHVIDSVGDLSTEGRTMPSP